MRKHIKLFGFLAFTALFFSACATAEKEEVIDMAKVKVEIQAMENAYAAGEKAKDADAVAAYYSDDAISYSRNKEPLQGKQAIRNDIANEIANEKLKLPKSKFVYLNKNDTVPSELNLSFIVDPAMFY